MFSSIKKLKFCFLALGALLMSFASARAEDKLRVGFIGAFSGPAREYGEASKNGFELALKDFASTALQVIYEDDQFSPAKTVAAFSKLVEVDKVNVLISIGSTPSNAIAPLADKNKIPLIAWASDTHVAKGHPYVLRSWVSGEGEGKAIAAELKVRAYKRPSLLIATSDYARSVQAGLVEALGGPAALALNEEYEGTAQDFKLFLLKARAKESDAIGLCLNPGQSALVAKQARILGMRVNFFGCEMLHDRNEISQAQGALEGAWFVTGDVDPTFRERYMNLYASDSIISGAAVHYDVARLLVQAAKLGVGSESLMRNILSSGESRGQVGTFSVKSEGGDQWIDIALIVREIKGNGFVSVTH